MCAHYALFPSSLRIELCDNTTDVVLYHGEFGDVSKRNYEGRKVAVKTLKTRTANDLQATIHVRCQSRSVSHVAVDKLTVDCAEVLQRVRVMENSSASERTAADGSDGDRG